MLLAAVTFGAMACRENSNPAAPPAEPSTAAAQPTPSDQLLLAAARIALPPPGITAASLPEPGSPGAAALTTYCAQCHELPSPAMHSATDWPSVVRRMWLRMDRLPGDVGIRAPDEGSRAQLLSYLMANALQVGGANLPAGEGRYEFMMVCSRCHALPDPRVHSPKDWLAVFSRMERNMERMLVVPATPEETNRILSYLQSSAVAR
jgi:cytochrome c5